MSIRRGYWWQTDDRFDGPFPTVKEAKASAPTNEQSVIRTMIALEKRDANGDWQTIH